MAKKDTKKAEPEAEAPKAAGKVKLKSCTVAGQEYIPGSNVEMAGPGGGKVTKTCNGTSGAWEPVS